jgi:hypothetical protein
MFIVFGSITAAWGLVLIRYLPDTPGKAMSLTGEERYIAAERTRDTRQKSDSKEFKLYQVWDGLTDPQAWLLCANMFGCMIVNSGFSSVGLPFMMKVKAKTARSNPSFLLV